MTELHKGKSIEEQLCFMEGVLPLKQSPFTLACVKMELGISADIHIFFADEYNWILLLDARREETRSTLIQQKTNELNLLRKKMFNAWNQVESNNAIERTDIKTLGLADNCRHQEVSVLKANLRKFDSGDKLESSEQIFETFEKYLEMAIIPVVEAGGILTSFFGTEITAVFGVLPTITNSSDQAVTAAVRMVEIVNNMNKEYKRSCREDIVIEIGIASGIAVVGFRNNKKRDFNVIGYPMEQAVKLLNQANPFTIIIDYNSWRKIELEDKRKQFSDTTPEHKDRHIFSLRIHP